MHGNVSVVLLLKQSKLKARKTEDRQPIQYKFLDTVP